MVLLLGLEFGVRQKNTLVVPQKIHNYFNFHSLRLFK